MLTSFVGGVVSGETILSSGFYFVERWRQLTSFVNIKLPQTTQKMNFRRDNDEDRGSNYKSGFISSSCPSDLLQTIEFFLWSRRLPTRRRSWDKRHHNTQLMCFRTFGIHCHFIRLLKPCMKGWSFSVTNVITKFLGKVICQNTRVRCILKYITKYANGLNTRYKPLPKAQRTQGIEYFVSFNIFNLKRKLQKALKS